MKNSRVKMLLAHGTNRALTLREDEELASSLNRSMRFHVIDLQTVVRKTFPTRDTATSRCTHQRDAVISQKAANS